MKLTKSVYVFLFVCFFSVGAYAQENKLPAPPPSDLPTINLQIIPSASASGVRKEESTQDLKELQNSMIKKAFKERKLRKKLIDAVTADEKFSRSLIEVIIKERESERGPKVRPAPAPVDILPSGQPTNP